MENEKDIREIKQEETEKKSKSIKEKIKIARGKVKDSIKAGYNTIKDNRMQILEGIVFTGLVVKGVKGITDNLGFSNRTKYEKTVNERRKQYYDPSSRRYYELRREPYQYELIEIEERRRTGEPVSLILSDMGLLKRW
jgi:hypothetical protein